MAEHILLLTGKLAEPSLQRTADALTTAERTFAVHNIGISVAGLMTTDMIKRRWQGPEHGEAPQRVIVPGLCAGDLDDLSRHLGLPVERGPDDLKDLPAYFGQGNGPDRLGDYDIRIFAEIVDAPELGIDAILRRAEAYRRDGADVIDLGCLPGTRFPHLEDSVAALKNAGYEVSVDSLDISELRRGGLAGADYLLSLSLDSLDLLEEVAATPIVIPDEGSGIDGLYRAIDRLQAAGRRFIADSILDPVQFGFTASILRYAELRRRYPDIEIMMGIGNVTELTDADTGGMNALLAGMMSELEIRHLLTTQVSSHARSVVREIDRARRLMFAARRDRSLPRGYGGALLALHEKRPFPYSVDEIEKLAAQIRDPNYRIQVSEAGIHIYNRDGLWTGDGPYALFEHLAELADDAPHAFYMGVELARAEIALRLGKRYVQDEELRWASAVPSTDKQDTDRCLTRKRAGPTLQARRAPNARKKK